MKNTIGLSLALIISGGLMGCTTTDGNANLRNANSNTGYVTSSPTPMATSTPATNYNSGSTSGNSSPNANHMSNANTKPMVNTNTKTNSNPKGNSNH